MKKLLCAFTVAAVVISFLAGCKGKDAVNGGDPKTVLTAFFELMSKKDFDGAAKLATKESKGTMDMMKKAVDMGESMKDKMGDVKEKDNTEDFKNMQIGEAKIDGDNATVSVTNPGKDNATFAFPLKKEGGDWKVDFSMGTLMKMGMNEAGKKNKDNKDGEDMKDYDPTDTTNSMDQFNKLMNSDSLKLGLEKLDSLMKSLDPEKMKQVKEAMEKLKKGTDQ
ncbi:MAG: hypothetical protein ABIP79_07345 [Chitinophagaceae bacterium]